MFIKVHWTERQGSCIRLNRRQYYCRQMNKGAGLIYTTEQGGSLGHLGESNLCRGQSPTHKHIERSGYGGHFLHTHTQHWHLGQRKSLPSLTQGKAFPFPWVWGIRVLDMAIPMWDNIHSLRTSHTPNLGGINMTKTRCIKFSKH